jgi:hypothetical protein
MLAMAGGGSLIAGAGASNVSSSNELGNAFALQNSFAEAVRNMPAPIVGVKNISDAMSNVRAKNISTRL